MRHTEDMGTNTFRVYVVLLSLTALLILLTASCGGGGSQTVSSTSPATPVPTPSTSTSTSVPLTPSRTTYVRTDAATEYFLWANFHWGIFHASTGRFFVTDPNGNRVVA